MIPEKQIRAYYTSSFIRVYQAYSHNIADNTLKNGKFTSPSFNFSRMTWIKPSFLWMMYRSGWAEKDAGQNRILAIDISHRGFQEIITQGALNQSANNDYFPEKKCYKKPADSDVIIQWDPERDILLNKLYYRTIQIGLRGDALNNYTEKWIVDINDITQKVKNIHSLVLSGELKKASKELPKEAIYNIWL